MKAWLGLGSNLQQPVKQLKEALNRLGETDKLEVLRVSSFYRTPPWGDEEQDDFINAVAEIETSLDPVPLLRVLQSIENTMGRQRDGRRWGPRRIDLDLLLYGEQQYQSAELVVPHPRMSERAFVLVPMCELEAELEIPGHGAAEKLLQKLDRSGIDIQYIPIEK
jgi:2-amino-4-hydroxy-6-hydroxymethyldihydropteridine diphosphokinase